MAQKFSNAARGALAAGISASSTTILLNSGGGALFPVANTGASAISSSADWFKAVLQDDTTFEVIYVRTHTSGNDSFSDVLRGQDGTTAAAFAADTIVGLRPLAADSDAAVNQRVVKTSNTGSAVLPAGTTAQRDASPADGYIRYNSDAAAVEVRAAGSWQAIGASGFIEGVVEFTATAGQTSFAATYTPGLLSVYRNGVRLGTADYTATSGTSVVLSSAAALNDHVAVVKYVAAAIANAVAKSGDTMTGPLAVPAGATGSQAPRVSEVWSKADLVAGRNKIVNSDWRGNVRNVSGTITLSAGQYGHDCWKAGSGGCTYSVATANNVSTVTITAGSLIQVVDGQRLVSGTHVFSWTGTAQGRIATGAYLPSGQTTSVSGGSNVTLEFGTGTITNPQFEPGSTPTPYEQLTPEAAALACSIYVRGHFGASSGAPMFTHRGSQGGGNGMYHSISWQVPMRTAPLGIIQGTFSTSNASQPTVSGTTRVSCTTVANAAAAGDALCYSPGPSVGVILTSEL